MDGMKYRGTNDGRDPTMQRSVTTTWLATLRPVTHERPTRRRPIQRPTKAIYASERYGVISPWQGNVLISRRAARLVAGARRLNLEAEAHVASASRTRRKHFRRTLDARYASVDSRSASRAVSMGLTLRLLDVRREPWDHAWEGRSMLHQKPQANASDRSRAATTDP